jgi:hypothetical protein
MQSAAGSASSFGEAAWDKTSGARSAIKGAALGGAGAVEEAAVSGAGAIRSGATKAADARSRLRRKGDEPSQGT